MDTKRNELATQQATPIPMKFFGRGFPLSDADLFLSAAIRVDPRPNFLIRAAHGFLARGALICNKEVSPFYE